MLDDIKKSISAILYERTTSPLFGTFFFSWIIWNWKIILVLFFTETDQIKCPKFEYIEENLLNSYNGIIYPIISTILILTLYNWLSLQTYRLWLYFHKEKNNYKNSLEKEKLLTREQSIKLRLELSRNEENFENILNEKEQIIEGLKNENKELRSQVSSDDINIDKQLDDKPKELADKTEIDKFFDNKKAIKYFETIANYSQKGWEFEPQQIPDNIVSYFIAYNLLKKGINYGTFDLTDKGKEYLKEYYSRNN